MNDNLKDALASFSDKLSFKPDWKMYFTSLQQQGDWDVPIRYFKLMQSSCIQSMTKEALTNGQNIFDVEVQGLDQNKLTTEDFSKALDDANIKARTLYWNEREKFIIDVVDEPVGIIFYSKNRSGWEVRVLSYDAKLTKVFDGLKVR